MHEITIMGYFLEEFTEVGSIECPSCGFTTSCGWGVRTNFQLDHETELNRYELGLIANEYHICKQCHRAFFFRVNVFTNKPLDV